MKWIRILIAHLMSEALTPRHSLVCANGHRRARAIPALCGAAAACLPPAPPAQLEGKKVFLSRMGKYAFVYKGGKSGGKQTGGFVSEKYVQSCLNMKDLVLGGVCFDVLFWVMAG